MRANKRGSATRQKCYTMARRTGRRTNTQVTHKRQTNVEGQRLKETDFVRMSPPAMNCIRRLSTLDWSLGMAVVSKLRYLLSSGSHLWAHWMMKESEATLLPATICRVVINHGAKHRATFLQQTPRCSWHRDRNSPAACFLLIAVVLSWQIC